MPEITEQDRQAAEDAWTELATGQFCFADAFSRDVIAAVIADAIAQSREAGRREGIEAAAKILEQQEIDWLNTLTGCPLSQEAHDNIEHRAAEMGVLAYKIRALLPEPTTKPNEGATP